MKITRSVLSMAETLRKAVDDYCSSYLEQEQWLREISEAGEEEKKEEVDKILMEAASYAEEILSEAETADTMVEHYLNCIRTYEGRLLEYDKSYAKRKENGSLRPDERIRYPEFDPDDIEGELCYIAERMEYLEQDLSHNLPLYPIRELMAYKGGKRDLMYSEFFMLSERAGELEERYVPELEVAGETLSSVRDGRERLLREILERYEDEDYVAARVSENRVLGFREHLEAVLQKFLSPEDLLELQKRAAKLEPDPGCLKRIKEPPRELLMGFLEYEIPIKSDKEYCEALLSDLYGSFTEGEILRLPLLLDGRSAHSLCFVNLKEEETEIISGFLCRYLMSCPAGSVRCCFVDGYSSGADFGIFRKIGDADRTIMPWGVASTTEKIHAALDEILSNNERILQRSLGEQENIFRLNLSAQRICEKYTILAIRNFPCGFDVPALEKLQRILRKSRECGVTILLDYKDWLPDPEETEFCHWVEQILSGMESWSMNDGMLFSHNPCPYRLSIKGVPGNWDSLCRAYGEAILEKKNNSVSLEKLLPAPQQRFEGSTAEEIRIPFGVQGASGIQCLTLGTGTAQSGVILGDTGSGKSTMLNSMILSAAARYGPEELELYLMDFKEGVEFNLYADHPVPQIRFVSVESKQELGVCLFTKLVDEIRKRNQMFKKEASGIRGIAEYRRKTGKSMPRILLVLDEFEQLFDLRSNRQAAEKCAELLMKVVMQGRNTGVHVIMASQRMAHLADSALDKGLLDQMHVRIGLLCDQDNAEMLFPVKPEIVKEFGTIRGEGAYCSGENCVPEKFETAFLPEEKRAALLDEIREYWKNHGDQRKPVVYDGTAPVKLKDLLSKTNDLYDLMDPSEGYRILAGESMGEVKPFLMEFVPENKAHLLFISREKDLVTGLITTFVKSILKNVEKAADFKDPSPSVYIGDIQRRQNQSITIPEDSSMVRIVSTESGIEEILSWLLLEYRRRKEQAEEGRPLFLILRDLENMDCILDTLDDSGDPDEDKTPGEIFHFLLEKGPRENIFFLVHMDSAVSVKKLSYGDPEYFGKKLISRMSPEDSEFLTGSEMAAKLSDYQLVFCDEDAELMKLKAYRL